MKNASGGGGGGGGEWVRREGMISHKPHNCERGFALKRSGVL